MYGSISHPRKTALEKRIFPQKLEKMSQNGNSVILLACAFKSTFFFTEIIPLMNESQ